MDDVLAQGGHVAGANGFRACGFDPILRTVLDLAPENIVLAAGVDADHSPHLMVVGFQGHHRAPHKVEDCQIVGNEQLVDAGLGRFAQPLEDVVRV